MVLVDGKGLPMGVRLESASPSEVKLVEATVVHRRSRVLHDVELVVDDATLRKIAHNPLIGLGYSA
jgi:hypothetical protein